MADLQTMHMSQGGRVQAPPGLQSARLHLLASQVTAEPTSISLRKRLERINSDVPYY